MMPRNQVVPIKIMRIANATTAPSPPGRRRSLLSLEVGVFPIQRASATDRLHDVGAELLRQLARGLLRRHIGRLRECHLHQLVRPERVVERLAQGVGETLMAHVHHRTEMVCFGAQRGAFFRRESHGRAACMRRKSGYGLIGSPSQYLPSAGMRMTW